MVKVFKRKSLAIFTVIFIHVSLLDFFYVTPSGAVFLIEESLQWKTIATHVSIAAFISLTYFWVVYVFNKNSNKRKG